MSSGSRPDLGRHALPNVRLRKLGASSDPEDRARVLGWIRERRPSGLVPVRGIAVIGHELEVSEEQASGLSLGEELGSVHAHVTTAVALSIVGEAALALARLHGLDRAHPPIHGQLTLHDLILTTEGEVRVAGIRGDRGRPEVDVRALISALRELLRPKAAKPGGAKLLERLSALHFDSAADLHQTIGSHLQKQDPERLRRARLAFVRRLLEAIGGPRPTPAGEPVSTAPAEDGSSPVFAAHLREGFDDGLVETVQTDTSAHAELRAALDGTFAGPGTSDSEPFFDTDATEAVSEAEALASWMERVPIDDLDDDLAAATSVMEVDAAALARAGAELGDDSPFGSESLGAAPMTGGSAAEVQSTSAARDGLMAPAAPREEPSAAVLVGDYRVVAAIGKGGMGEIYLARALKQDRLVALKVLAAYDDDDDEALGMLMDEAAIMARIEHPHVLKVVDFGRAEDRYYLASEYLEGRPLVRVMIESYDRDGGLDHSVVACVGAQSARGLHAAHTATSSSGAALEVVHRDVSPQNIFVTYSGNCKVIDFGVARATERFSRTQVGLVKGKAAYMSPEQAEGKVLDARSDVFSLGVCLWEMVAGQRLFKQGLDYDTLVAVQTAPIEPPSVIRGVPDPELDAIILRALARDLEDRTPSAEALAIELEGYAQSNNVVDGAALIRTRMDRLFHEEAQKERELVAQLEARGPTDAEVASLRELSGVSPRSTGKVITFVGEPDGLGALDRYGETRVPTRSTPPDTLRKETGEHVIDEVRRLEAERRSGEYPAQPRPPTPIRDLGAPTSPEPPVAPRRSLGAPWPWILAAVALTGGAFGVWWSRGAWPTVTAKGPERLDRAALVARLERAGAELSPGPGVVRRVDRLGVGPLLLDDRTRAWAMGDDAVLLELTPVESGPAVVWVPAQGAAQGLSVNDCPATARPSAEAVTLAYGGRQVRLSTEAGAPTTGLANVLLVAPRGATRLAVQPVGLGFGRARAPAGTTACPTGWRPGSKVELRRLPPGVYELEWTGPGLAKAGRLVVSRDGITGGQSLRGD